MRRPGLTQLFSFDPAMRPSRCPKCGWGCFWQHENCGHAANICLFQCERCHALLRDADLIPADALPEAPATEAPRCIDCERLIANPARTGHYCALCYRGAA